MAGEEKLKTIAEAVARALGSGEGQAPPMEAPAPPEVAFEAPKPAKKSFITATTEKLKAFAEKVTKGVPEAAKKIVHEGERPRDARLLSIVEEIVDADETALADPSYMRRVGEKLVYLMRDAGPVSETAREAYTYLRRITTEHKSLADLRFQAEAVLREGKTAVDRLFDPSQGDELVGTGLDEKLEEYQQMLRYDEGPLHNTHHIAQYVEEVKKEGLRRGIDTRQVKEAVRRLQDVITETNYAQEEMSRAQMTARGRYGQEVAIVRWSDVKEKISKGATHADHEDFRQFGYITPDEAALLRRGDEGVDEWAHRFLNKIYGFGKERASPDFPEMQKWNEFESYIEWLYGEDSAVVQSYRYLWKDFGRHQAIVTGILYQPGDARDKTKWFRLLTGDDLEFYVRNFDYANYAMPLYEQAVMDLLNNRRATHHAKLSWLKEKIQDPLGGGQVARDELYKKLKEQHRKAPLSKDRQLLMAEIGDAIDTVREGAMLWDEDVINYAQLGMELQVMERQKIALDKKLAAGGQLNEAERFEYDRLTREIPLRAEKFNRNNGKSMGDMQDLDRNFNYSVIDREVYERLKVYLKARGEEVPEWKIKRAIWAARQAMIGSGHLVAISSFMAIRPALEYGIVGKEIMRSPAFEEYQRIFNPDLFIHRFTMGAEMGETARNIMQRNLLKSKGYDTKKIKAWLKEQEHISSQAPFAKLARAYLRFAEEDVGIPFSEMLTQGFFAGGGSYDGSGWRLEKGVLDEIRKRFLRMRDSLPDGAVLDNQALGIQLLTTPAKEENKAERLKILNRMMERTPSKFLQLLGRDRDTVLALHNMNEDDLRFLQRALSMAEMKLWDYENLKTASIDLTSDAHFAEHVVPFLRELGAPTARYAEYQGVLQDLKEVFTRERSASRDGKRALLHKSLRDAWVDHQFPMTLMLSDFNWKDANLFQLGLIAMDRRGRDIEGMALARDAWIKLVSDSAFLSPNEPIETLKKLKEYRDAVNSYAAADVAENATYEMLRVFLEFNRNRALWTQAIPGLEFAVRRFGETDMSGLKDHWLLSRIVPHWKEFAEKRLEHLPHSIAEAFSYSVRYHGWEGNAFDEQEIEKLISTAQDMGMFSAYPELAHKLRNEFKSTMGWRALGILRKYWWVVLLATVAIAATKSLEDEEKRHN